MWFFSFSGGRFNAFVGLVRKYFTVVAVSGDLRGKKRALEDIKCLYNGIIKLDKKRKHMSMRKQSLVTFIFSRVLDQNSRCGINREKG